MATRVVCAIEEVVADMMQNPKSILYVLFLNWILPILAKMYKGLHRQNEILYMAYIIIQKYIQRIQKPFLQNWDDDPTFADLRDSINPNYTNSITLIEKRTQSLWVRNAEL